MEKVLARYWWSFYVRGIIAILIGLIAIFLPEVTLEVLAVLIGAFFLVDGIFSIAASFGSRRSSGERWWIFVLEGIVGVVIGIMTFIWPEVTVMALVLLVSVWALITGILEIIASVKLRRLIENEWLLTFTGILSILFALILAISPGAGAFVLVWLLGLYAIFFGILLIFFGRKLKKIEF
ncbi:MAG: HdeD family acid-resistance protein [Thermodesulfobacteriota bacterium]